MDGEIRTVQQAPCAECGAGFGSLADFIAHRCPGAGERGRVDNERRDRAAEILEEASTAVFVETDVPTCQNCGGESWQTTRKFTGGRDVYLKCAACGYWLVAELRAREVERGR